MPDPRPQPIVRVMVRCGNCRAWWSVLPGDGVETCPCGGWLVAVDWKAHMESLPYTPHKPPNGANQ